MEILALGEKIKRRRKELNMTLKDLAGDRITPGQISLVESGKSNPSMDLLEYLAGALNTSIEYLMESEEAQAEKICTYFENIIAAFILSEDFSLAEKYVESAINYAEKYKLEYRKAKNLFLRGVIYMKQGKTSKCQQFFLAANILFIKLNCSEDIINTFLKLGIITLHMKAYNSSHSYFKQAEKVFKDNDIGNDFLLGEIYYYIAYTYHKLENNNQAIEYSNLAKQKFKELDNKKEYAKTLLKLSLDYSSRGDINNAIQYSKKSMDEFKAVHNLDYLAEIENNLGRLFFEFENYDEAFEHLNKSKKIREEIDKVKLVETLLSVCDIYIKLKDLENSNKVLNEIYEHIGNCKDKLLVEYYILKYRVLCLQGDGYNAESTLNEALSYASLMGYNKDQAEISIMLGKFYVDNGKSKEAAEFLSRGIQVFKSIGTFKDFE
ncbi:helix-turn-helix transcriptional regulator [Clostridium sp. YIM B02515]|uniref:Helix-turn-helix transcriptional regulator n=1 Tax=Clostridium rhizosphaerae TaxID=2803861 RepID=A0ABS1TFB7_9CLOT|nr:helix-turn-helix transcriptional regulator [Clostridium rhizosphaerae]MBL4936653.1 helix-turn-helix transcriptional regulator [Clostridium rhizosphaerae]